MKKKFHFVLTRTLTCHFVAASMMEAKTIAVNISESDPNVEIDDVVTCEETGEES